MNTKRVIADKSAAILRVMSMFCLIVLTATSAPAFNISGSVSNITGKTGRVYLSVLDSQYSGNSPVAGVSIPSAGSYTIRGLPDGGNYIVFAFLDTQNSGTQQANDPVGISTGTVTSSNPVANIALFNPPQPASLQPPANVKVVFGSDSATIFYDRPKSTGGNGYEIATSYKVYWILKSATNPNPGPTNFTGSSPVMTSEARDAFVAYNLANPTLYNFAVTASLDGTESAAVLATAQAVTGTFSVSGTVTTTGMTLPIPGTHLLALMFENITGKIFTTSVANPVASQGFSFTGVSAGSYTIYTILDLNNNGVIDLGDVADTEKGVPVTVTTSNITNVAVSLVAADAAPYVKTKHLNNGSDSYSLNLGVYGIKKRPVNVSVSGQQVTTRDLAMTNWNSGSFETSQNVASRPALLPTPDSYSFTVEYSTAGGASPLSAPITGIVDSFATPIAPNGTIDYPVSSPLQFSWSQPNPLPAYPYRYGFWVNNPNGWFDSDPYYNMPSSTTSVNIANTELAVQAGVNYTWAISLKDSYGNSSEKMANFVSGSGSISGKVTSNGTAGIAYTYAVLLDTVNGWTIAGVPEVLTNSTTGAYTISNIPVGNYKLAFVAGPGYQGQFYNGQTNYSAAQVLNVTPGVPLTNIDAVLAAAPGTGTIAGMVTNATTTLPVSNAYIELLDTSNNPIIGFPSARSTSTGGFQFSAVPSGDYKLRINAGGGYYIAAPATVYTVSSGVLTPASISMNPIAPPPPVTFAANGTYTYTYAPSTPQPLTLNWTGSDFLCDGPDLGTKIQYVTFQNATTMIWQTLGSTDTMTWTRPGGTAGVISGAWYATDSTSGSSFTITFNADGTMSVSGSVSQCGTNGPTSISSITPASGAINDLVTINGSNFSPILSHNTVMFNGVQAVVTDVQAGRIFAIVPTGATSGTISVTNSGGTVTSALSFAIVPGTAPATLRWGGVTHRIDSDVSEFDALDIGLNSFATTLAGMTLSVSGPGGFSYAFSDADIDPYLNGRLAVYKKYPTPAPPLQPGVYTITLNDGQGHISHRVDTHVTVAAHLPQVDSATVQMQRKADGSYRISWAPLNDTKTYYYRLRISRNDTAETNVYDSIRDMLTYSDVPAGILFDNSMYKVKVQVFDSPDSDLATNRSDSAWKLFYPQSSDYDSRRLLVGYAASWNRFAPAQSTDVILNVDSPASVSSVELLNSVGTLIYTFLSTDRSGTDFYKNFSSTSTPTTLSPGAYTIRFVANSLTQYAYVTLSSPVAYPIPDATKMQAEYLDLNTIRFSWANVDYTGALYYRLVVNDTATGTQITTQRNNQLYTDLSVTSLGTLPTKQWRVEVYDSDHVQTQRNRSNSAYKALVPTAYEATKPVINRYRVRNMVTAAGVAFSHISVETAVSQSPFTSIMVSGPSAYSRNLMTAGRFSPAYNSYMLETPGSLLPGLYTITVTNAAGSAVRHMYVPAVHPLPQPDFKTLHNDLEPNGDLRISWAPVVSDIPVWYSFYVYAQADQNGDALMDQVYVINSLQLSSILIPASTVAGWPASIMGQVWAHDGSNFSTVNNVSQSRIVGLESPGFNYATLVDGDGDGFVSNADPNDANSAVFPFSAGNDNLPTTVTGTSPTNGAVDIATTGPFSVTFNKVIDQRTLAASFTLNNGATGAISYNPSTRTATFTPSAELLTGVTYTATISTALLDQAGHALSAPYSWNFTTFGTPPTLSVMIMGEGNINSNTGNPGIHGTTPGPYASPYAFNNAVALTASPRTGWDFTGWGGDGTCIGSNLICNLTMNAQTKNVTATFTVQQNIKNGANYYGTLTAALLPEAVMNNDTLLIKALPFAEGLLTYNVPGVRIKLRGGFTDAGFTTNTEFSTISNRLTIQRGTVSVEKIKIK
ncbi:MAG: Ig-like domain-containing protein [Desulfuromonadaceae bacterium]